MPTHVLAPFTMCRLSWHSKGQGRQLGDAVVVRAVPDALLPLGLDFLTFLAATVLVIPVFKSVNASPVLGFLFSGLVLGQLGCALPLLGPRQVLATCLGACMMRLPHTGCSGTLRSWRSCRSWGYCFCCLRWGWNCRWTASRCFLT